ncbi:hypothetical protein [Thermovibrio sp.]
MERPIQLNGRLKGVYLERVNSSNSKVFLSVSFSQTHLRPIKKGKKIEWWEYYHFPTRIIIVINNREFYITSDNKYVTLKIPALDLQTPNFSLFPESRVHIGFDEKKACYEESLLEKYYEYYEKKYYEYYEEIGKKIDKENEKEIFKPCYILLIRNTTDMIDAIKYISIRYAG